MFPALPYIKYAMSDLKTKLKHFSIRNSNDQSKHVLKHEEFHALKTLRANDNIVLQRPDKGGGVVIMNKTDYEDKLLNLISDPTKFTSNCTAKQSESIKSKINQ